MNERLTMEAKFVKEGAYSIGPGCGLGCHEKPMPRLGCGAGGVRTWHEVGCPNGGLGTPPEARLGACGESFGHEELPGIVVPYPNGHGDFRMPCSNPEPGHTRHRVRYRSSGGGRVLNINIEWEEAT